MFRFKSISIALAMCFLFGMISSSDAQIEIIDMSMSSEIYDYGYIYDSAYVETDIPYDSVDWFIGHPDDGDANLSWVHTTQGDGVATRAWFTPSVSGHIKGKKFRVAAKVFKNANDGSGYGWTDWETRDFVVFQPIYTTEVETPPKKMKSISGYSELKRQYYTGSTIAIDCVVYAYNPNDSIRWAWSRFKHSLTGRDTIERDHPGPNGEDAQRIGGDFGSYSHSDTLTHSDVNLENGGTYTSGAYVRLIVSGPGEDNYFVGHSETFTRDDKPYDAGDE